jgi:hypothetical protein
MAANEKILKALKSAITHLDASMLAIAKKDEALLGDTVWHIAAEVEYASFLFSIRVQDVIDKSKRRFNQKIKVEVGPMLVSVRDLLDEAKECVMSAKLSDAYKNVYIARNRLLNIQKDLAKKKRKSRVRQQ